MAIQYCNYDIKGTLAVADTSTFSKQLTVSSSVGGNSSWDDSGILIENTSTTTGEPTLAFRNAGSSGTGSNYWFTGLNQNNTYKIAYGTSFVDGNTKLELNTSGLLKLNAYGAGTLVSDASGNITVSSGGGAGGPYLPLSAGSTKKLTGDLYISKSSPAIYFDNLAGGGLDPILTASGTNFTISTSSTTPLSLALDTGNATFAGDITVSGGDITLSGNGRIQGVDTVSASTDAANKAYVDSAVAGSGSGTVTSVATGSGLTGGTITTTGTVSVDYGTSGLIADAPGGSGSPDVDDLVLIGQDSSSGGETRSFTLADLPFTNNTGDITGVTAGTLLDGGGTSGSVTLNVDLSELTAATGDMISTDSFAITRSNGSQFKIVPGLVPNNLFPNDAGYITSASIPSVGNGTLTMTTNTGLDGSASFTANQSGNSTFAVTLDLTEITLSAGLDAGATSLSLDLSEFTDMTATMLSTDEFIVLDSGAERRKAAGEIGNSIFINDANYITSASLPTVNNATITIAAGTNLTTGGNFTTNQSSNETITINMATGGVGAGSYGSTSNSTKIDNITVDAYGRVTAVTTGATGQVNTINSGNSNTLSKSGSTTVTLTPKTGTVSSSSSNLATGAQIQTAIDTAVTGVLKYDGTWNASTNSPTLSSGSGTVGEYYIVSVAGSTNLDGITDWAVGDWAVFSDQATDAWQKIDNTQVGNVTGSGSSGRVAYWNGASNITSDSAFTFDQSSNNLTVGGSVTWSGGSSAESNDAYDNTITGFSDSGSSTTTLTLTQRDGGTLTTSFSNPQGTMSSFVINTATGLDGAATVTNGGTVNLSLDLSEFAVAGTLVGTDEFIVLDGNAERKKAANAIGLSIFNNDAGFITSASVPSVGNGQIDGRTSGNGLSGSMDATANQSGNTTFTVTSNATTAATASTIAYRDSSADLNVRLLRANYSNQSTISGAIAFRVNNSSDNYTRYCSSPSAIRTFIGAVSSSGVTSVATGNGISGGTITSTGTLTVGAGDGLSQSSTGLLVDSTVVRTSGNQSIAGVKSFSSKIGADGGIDGLTNANGGITGSNYNISGVNQLTINDPGEGIVFTGTTTIYLDVIDDSVDNKLRIRNAVQLDLNGTARITNLANPTAAQDGATKSYVDSAVSGATNNYVTGGNVTSGTVTLNRQGLGNVSFTINNSQITNGRGFTTNTGTTTASNTQTFTNKSGNISQWTNDSGYVTSSGGSMSTWRLTGDSGGVETITDTETVDIAGGTGITTVRSGATITVKNTAPNIVQSTITGNAGSATVLQTARTIAGVSFNGSANISLNNNAITNGAGYITSGSLPTVNNGTLTMTTSTGLDGGTTFTANQSGNSTFAVTLDLSELTDMTTAIQPTVDEVILLDNGAERRKRFSEIFGNNAYNSTTIPTNNNQLTNGAGYVTSSGMSSWKITADSGGTAQIDQGETVDIAGGTNITTSRSSNTITINNGITNNNQLTNGAGYTTSTGTITGSGTDNQVALFNGTSAIESSANLTQGSGALGELGIAGYVNHIGGTNERFGWGLGGFLVQAGTNNQTFHVTTSAVKLGYGNGTSFTLQTDVKGIRVQDSIGGGAGTIFLGTGSTNFIKLSGSSVFLNSGFLSPTIELKNTGQLDLGAYTATSYQAGSSGTLSPTQNFQPGSSIGDDTLTSLTVDGDGNVVRGSQEATWSFTRAQLNALSNTRVNLLAAPGTNKCLCVEESNWLIESNSSASGTFTSDITCEIAGATVFSVATRITKARLTTMAGSVFNGIGIYTRDVPETDKQLQFNQPMTIRIPGGTNQFPAKLISVRLKIKYRVFDKATF